MSQIIHINSSLDDVIGEQPVQPLDFAHSLLSRHIKLEDKFEATKWIVNGIIPEGAGVIAGSSGVGKTSAIVPLCMAIAGFKSPVCDLEVEMPRKILYITEDDHQVATIIKGMRDFLKWDESTWNDVKKRFLIFGSRRITPGQLYDITIEALADSTIHNGIESTPLLVLDTSSANFEMENESSNSEASAFMSVLKQAYSQHELSSFTVSHLAKTAKGQAVDQLSNMSARGAGSFEGDATWTAVLSSVEESGAGPRVFKMDKVRANLTHKEIIFEGSVQKSTAVDRFGQTVDVEYRYTVPSKSSKEMRDQAQFRKKKDEVEEAIFEALESLEYPSTRDILSEVSFDQNLTHKTIKLLLLDKKLFEVNLPPEIKKKGRKTYIMQNHQKGPF